LFWGQLVMLLDGDAEKGITAVTWENRTLSNIA
jgi:hypothetical protein